MSDDTEYRKARPSTLQRLAAAGDAAAGRELKRRGLAVDPALDLTKLAYAALRELVLRYREGATPEARARSFEQAQRAQLELEARWAVAERLGVWPLYPHAQPPPVAPWRIPRPPRCVSWQRPTSSTLYLSDQDRARAALSALAKGLYQAK